MNGITKMTEPTEQQPEVAEVKVEPVIDMFVPASERIEQRFLDSSTYFLTGEICEDTITPAIKWLLYENMEDMAEGEEKVLTMYINSFGGDLYQAFALIDIMNRSRYPIATVGVGAIMSAGFLIFSAGTKGCRFVGENTGIMCHQFSSETSFSKYHDIKAMSKENDSMNQRMLTVLASASGLPERQIKSKLLGPSDVWLTPQELVDLKIADQVF